MTRAEAKCIIKDMLDDAEKYGDIDYDNLNDFISACKVAIEVLSDVPDTNVGKWIPVSERLPEYDKDVLCYTDAEEFIVGYRVDNWGQDAWITGEFGDGEFNAIAWMPLPSPYKGESEDT